VVEYNPGWPDQFWLLEFDSRRFSQGAYTIAMKFRIVLEFDPDARSFSAICPELPGCASAGETEEEARDNIKEAIKLYLARGDSTAGKRQAGRGHDWVNVVRRG